MKDDWKGDIIKAIRKHKKNWQSKPNFGGGITIYIKESSEEINESILITTSVLLALSGIWMKYDSPYEDEGLSGWWKKKVVPKLQSFMSTDKKINQIINKLKNNPNAIEEITNASEKDKTETIKKYIDSKDFDYISKIISKIKR